MTESDGALLPTIPVEFECWEPASPFMQQLCRFGQIFRRRSDETLALRVTAAHANMHSNAHGGLLATLVDCAIGHVINTRLEMPVVTVQTSANYLKAAKMHSWLEAHACVDRQGKNLIFATCVLTADGDDVLKATAVFAVRHPVAAQTASPGSTA